MPRSYGQAGGPIDGRGRALVVSDDLPEAWHLQSLLLQAGLLPRTVSSREAATVDETVELVVFDRGVPGLLAMDVLARVRSETGTEVAPALFLGGGGGVATAPRSQGERRLDGDASDAEISLAVLGLLAGAPVAEPRVMPAVEEIDVGQIVGLRPGVIGYRRRTRAGLIGPLGALALFVGAIAGFSAIIATPPIEPASEPELASVVTAAPTVPAEPIAAAGTGAPTVSEDSVVAAPAPPQASVRTAPAEPIREEQAPRTSIDQFRTVLAAAAPAPIATAASGATSNASPTSVPTTPAGLEGRVTDSFTGHGLPGAVVVYRGSASGQTTTDGDGRYRIIELPPGRYEVAAVAPGYAQAQNRAGVVAETLTTDNLALSPMGGTALTPFQAVMDQRSGQPVAAYGYATRAGDTLGAIAERAGTTVDELLALNRVDEADQLAPGRVLYLPASTFGQK